MSTAVALQKLQESYVELQGHYAAGKREWREQARRLEGRAEGAEGEDKDGDEDKEGGEVKEKRERKPPEDRGPPPELKPQTAASDAFRAFT